MIRRAAGRAGYEEAVGSCMTERTIWAMTDGKAGMVSQALGLAEAIAEAGGPGWGVVEKTVVPAAPWSLVPAVLWLPSLSCLTPDSSPLAPPWPAIVVSCGRNATGPAIQVRRRSGGRSFIVHAQHPRLAMPWYDFAVAQSHDRLGGRNVVTVRGSMNRITGARLAAAAAHFGPRFADLPRPVVAVAIGGSNGSYRMTAEVAHRLAGELRRLVDDTGGSLLVTASRRTGTENEAILRAALSRPTVRFWDGQGENPYFAYLALADAIVVTCDSVNMVSEACAAGKPVFVATLDGGSGKFERFHAEMHAGGHTRPFRGALERWTPAPLDETRRVAVEVLRRHRARGDRSPQRG